MCVSAEFIIDLADKNTNFDNFKKALIENGAEFSDSFMTNLLRIIQHMKPAALQSENKDTKKPSNSLAEKFPGLAIPNEKPHFSSDDDSDINEKKSKRITTKDIFKGESKNQIGKDEVVDQAMAELEALAPSNIKNSEVKNSSSKDYKDEKIDIPKSKERPRRRSRSRDRSRNKRSRSRGRRSRSRDKRSRSGDKRTHSRDRRRRSRSHHRDRSRSHHRDRSRDRYRRSRSRGKRSWSKEKDFKRDRDYGKKLRKKSPEVEISDDPEPGKVRILNTFFI